jgi:tubulin polyglutamylase TTLL6/13
VAAPLLVDKKKFDLRLYVLVRKLDPIEAYLCTEGMVRMCTENYKKPERENIKNLFMHLTNFNINKMNDKYIPPAEEFLENENASKRLYTKLMEQLEEDGIDSSGLIDQIEDTCAKLICGIEPYLLHNYHVQFGKDHENANCF